MIKLTKLKLSPDVEADVKGNEYLSWVPRWEIQSNRIIVAPPYIIPTQPDLNKYVGSLPWLWDANDILLFSKQKGLLECLYLQVPEQNFSCFIPMTSYNSTNNVKGRIELHEVRNFSLPSGQCRWMNNTPQILFVLYQVDNDIINVDLKVEVAQDIWLLFCESELIGWAMENPARYVVAVGDYPDSIEPSDNFKNALKIYFDLVEDKNIEQMEHKDEQILFMLQKLMHELKGKNSDPKRSNALYLRIYDLIELFYG